MQTASFFLRIGSWFVLVAVLSALWFPVCLTLLPWRGARVRMGNLYGKIVGRTGVWLIGARPVIHNRERLNDSFPAIYISNHASNLDIVLGMWMCPIGGCGVAKKEVARIPFFGWLYMLSGHLLVDRQNRDNAIAALREVAEAVHKYRLGIWIWPEGTRSKDGRLLPFKKGLGHLALATGLPIVPVVIHNAHKAWVKHSFKTNSMDVHIDVLPPLSTADWTLEGLDAHLEAVRQVMIDQLGDEQKPLLPALPESPT